MEICGTWFTDPKTYERILNMNQQMPIKKDETKFKRVINRKGE